MTEKELSIALREMAREKGLCDEWYYGWKDTDGIDVCLDRFVDGQYFAMDKDYPSLSFGREHFKKEDLHRHHIYIDEEVDLSFDESTDVVLFGDCRGVVRYSFYSIGSVYVRHGSKVRIEASDMAKVFVTCVDVANVECVEETGGRIKVHSINHE